MALPITPRDILIRWVGDNKPISEDDESFIELFNDAIEIALLNVKNLEELVSNGETPLSTVKQVITAMLTRYYSIGQEYRSSYSETVGSFSHSGSVGGDVDGRGVMTILPSEISLLSGYSTNNKVASVQWGHEYRSQRDTWELQRVYSNSEIAGVNRID